MEWSIHHRIARTALRLQILDFGTVSEILTDLGARAASAGELSVEVWSKAGWLTEDQLRRVFDEMGRLDLISDESPESDAGNEALSVGDTLKDSAVDTIQEGPGLHLAGGDTEVSAGEGPPHGGDPFETKGGTQRLGDISTATIDVSSDDAAFGGDDCDKSDPRLAFERTGLYQPPSRTEGFLELEDRYDIGAELGRGGGGLVVEAYDRCLKRNVAMKIQDASRRGDQQAVERFLSGAQTACQLEHPNILPVYDVGVRDDGAVYYTMLLARGETLGEVLDGIRKDDSDYRDNFDLSELLEIVSRVAQALDYAHSKGVIHRDLKPDNIMLGEFGEVMLMDWGLAEVKGDGIETKSSTSDDDLVAGVHTVGTPSYMSPEQAKGKLDELDERSDVYSLGAVLYEVLSLRPPYQGEDAVETIRDVIDGRLQEPTEQIDYDLWEISEQLEAICMKAMARRPQRRYASAGDFSEVFEEYLRGGQRRGVENDVALGRRAAERYREDHARIEKLRDEIESLREQVEPWDPIDEKRPLWQLEDERDELTVERARAFGAAANRFRQALATDSDCQSARRELAELYWQRYCEAEAAGDRFEQAYFGQLLRESGDDEFVDRLTRRVEVTVKTRPSDADVTLFPYEEMDRRLVVTGEQSPGTTPIEDLKLEVGRYLMVLDPEDRAMVRTPLYARRGEAIDLRVHLPAQQNVEPDFAFVPGGPCTLGGDPEALNPRPRRRMEVNSFFCASLPVTFRDYLEYLDTLPFEEAQRFAPRTRKEGGYLVFFDEKDGRWKPAPFPEERTDGSGRLSADEEDWDLPVVGISAVEAKAYAKWRSRRDERSYRLPTEQEWEKAGRGQDGRFFPWGDHFDATFCLMRQSRPNRPRLQPVGSFVDDSSPYGIRDLSGGIHEWCQGRDDGGMVLRGGAWDQGKRVCRLASNRPVPEHIRGRNIGLRLVYDIEFEDSWSGTQRVLLEDELSE